MATTAHTMPTDAWERARLFASTVEDHELLDPTLTPDRLLYRLFNEERVRVFSSTPLAALCQCSTERVHDMLAAMAPEERATWRRTAAFM